MSEADLTPEVAEMMRSRRKSQVILVGVLLAIAGVFVVATMT